MSGRWGRGVVALAVLSLAACDKPGPLSAVARGTLPPPPPQPAWAASLAGARLQAAFPNPATCIGFVDRRTDRYLGAYRVLGWAWNRTASQPIPRVAIVDAEGRMVGFGDGGIARQDVAAARPEVRSLPTGWSLVAPDGKAYMVYGLDPAARSACAVGTLNP